ncbi:placenta-expressed transcript 1 protein-like [Mixophyes fleayi]|uniref:placenta-expressed transcript 1 protein-like n=1 Tax=Mixophyes fleayi TaxID=3061075 RepID=UPI003F4E3C30
MAQSGLNALLLFLGLLVSTCYGATSNPQCELFNSTSVSNSSNSNFTLTVSPETLSSNTIYSVHLSGIGNATVNLEAESLSKLVGIWSHGDINCNQSFQFVITDQDGSQLQANWTSPENLTSVTIKAYIQLPDNSLFLITRELNSAIPTPTTNTTEAPSNGSSTVAATVTVNNSTVKTTLVPQQTTNAASAKQSNVISTVLIQIFCLLMITNKCLP